MKLELNHISKAYGKTKALTDFNAALEPGIYALLGPNGSGKSTLMNIITDNLKANKGEIVFDGQNVKSMGVRFREKIGFMPQYPGIYPSFTVEDYLWYMAKLKGLTNQAAREEIPKVLEAVELTESLKSKVGALSGGMKQRLCLASAVLGDPDILLLDEPTAGLDPQERIRIRNLISALSEKKIILIATHIVSDIESVADQVLVMKRGKLECFGTPDELEASVSECVREYPKMRLPEGILAQCRIGNVFRRGGESWVRLIGNALPEGGQQPDHLNLEDVYLYYLEGQNE